MALEESRTSTSARPAARPRGLLRGTEDVELDAVHARWSSTLERETRASSRVESAVRRIAQGSALADVDETWLAFLGENLQVCAFWYQSTHDALAQAAGRCRWGPVARAIDVEASMLQRQAQTVVLYAMDLASILGDVPLEAARARWETARGWEPARRTQAAVGLREDWGEIVVAVNVCLDPLVGQMIRREWGVHTAELHGDTTTPVLAEPAQVQPRWSREWTSEVLRAACTHPEHGEHNRATIAQWVRRWTPPAREAAEGLASLTQDLTGRDAAGSSLDRLLDEQRALVDDLGLTQEVAA